MIIHKDNYYIMDPVQQIILVFDKNGKFLLKINKQGRGPGEYLSLISFYINSYTDNIELLDPYGPVHIYDLSGNYIETKRIAYPDFRIVHMFAAVDSQTHVFHTVFEPKKIIYFNLDEEKLLHEEFEENRRLGSFSNDFYQYQDEWYFFRPIHPVVYRLGKEGLEPVFQFDFGKHTREGTTAVFSEEAERNISKCLEELFAQFPYLIHAVRHNSKYVFVSVSRNDLDDKANIIYDKSTGKTKFIPYFAERVWFNSYRGEEIIITDEYVLIPSQWVDMENRITKEMLDDKDKAIFDDLINAPMELNPVLIKYWFK